MAQVAIRSPLQYLDKASSALREMGLMPEKIDPAPINALLEKISDLDKDKIALIARTLGQAVKKDATALLTACGLALRSFD